MPYLLLIIVAVTHLAPDPLASLTGVDAALWYYPLRGLEGAAAFLLLALPRHPGRHAIGVCAWAVYEEALTLIFGCMDIAARSKPAPYHGLGDAHTGFPFYWLSVAICACLTLWIVATPDKKAGDG